jgi:SLT domain-containing protein
MVGLVKAPMEGIATIIKNTLRLIFKNLENAFNNFANRYNNLIKTVKKSGFGGLFGLLPTIPLLNIPKFAQGGVVTRPTVAMVGEGGESEYIIPESKMDKALDRFMIKAQGINAGGDGNPTINITTGPVVQFGGEQYVTVSDMQAAMQATAKGVLSSLRNPSTRISLGLA